MICFWLIVGLLCLCVAVSDFYGVHSSILALLTNKFMALYLLYNSFAHVQYIGQLWMDINIYLWHLLVSQYFVRVVTLSYYPHIVHKCLGQVKGELKHFLLFLVVLG